MLFVQKKPGDGFGAFSSPLHAQSTWNDDAMGRGLTPGICEGEVVVRVVLSLRRSRIFAFVYLHSSKKNVGELSAAKTASKLMRQYCCFS